MKKKIFSLIIGLLCIMPIFSGCNLFETELESYYDKIVAKAGNYEINKEELINGYYSYGQNLVQEYGSVEKALKETMNMLLQRKMLLDYVKKEAAKEEAKTTLEQEDYYYALTNKEYNDAVREAWDYIDGKVKTLVVEKYEDPENIFTSETKEDPELAGSRNEFTQTIVMQDGKIKLVEDEFENEASKLSLYDYKKPTFIEASAINEVWADLIEELKTAESYKKSIKDKSAKAVLNRELDRVFKTALDNAYLTKLQKSHAKTTGVDGEYLSAAVEQAILKKYTDMYNANKEEYDIDPEGFYNNVVNNSNRGNYVYFGSSEEIIEVQHILVKFANNEEEFAEDPYLTEEENKKLKEDLNTEHNTLAKQRDKDGYETGETISVYELRNTVIQGIINEAKGKYAQGTQAYADYVISRFNDLMYMYNEDGGILNAQFDYAIGSNGTTTMVEPFTNAAIDLYNLGYEGAVSDIVESSYGYHILIYTNKLTNVDLGSITLDKLASMKLSSSTCAEDNMLEFLYGKIKQDSYATYENNLLTTLESGVKYTYYKSNYKDLLD